MEESYTSATNSSNLRRELEPVWAADTQRRLLAMGLVPASLINSISTALQGATK